VPRTLTIVGATGAGEDSEAGIVMLRFWWARVVVVVGLAGALVGVFSRSTTRTVTPRRKLDHGQFSNLDTLDDAVESHAGSAASVPLPSMSSSGRGGPLSGLGSAALRSSSQPHRRAEVRSTG